MQLIICLNIRSDVHFWTIGIQNFQSYVKVLSNFKYYVQKDLFHNSAAERLHQSRGVHQFGTLFPLRKTDCEKV